MKHTKKWIRSILYAFLMISFLFTSSIAYAVDEIPFIILSQYQATLCIHETMNLIAITSNGKFPTFKSSDSKVASVNTYGEITAKKKGTAVITAKIKNAEASCKITVKKTELTLNKKNISLERNETFSLSATTSNHSPVTYKSNKKSVATVDENGKITGVKPGNAIITACADGTSKTCQVTVRQPEIKLNKSEITLLRGESFSLSATVSSGIKPVFRSNRSKIATVDSNGKITALKHGTALITVKADGSSQLCEVVVESPEITLEQDEITLAVGETTKIKYQVSSGNKPTFQSSNSKLVLVHPDGSIDALKSGQAYVTLSEDGAKTKCKIIIK